MGSESPQIADQDRPKPLALDYVSARVPPRFRPRRHGGPGNDWWALWAFVLWSVLVAGFIGLPLVLRLW